MSKKRLTLHDFWLKISLFSCIGTLGGFDGEIAFAQSATHPSELRRNWASESHGPIRSSEWDRIVDIMDDDPEVFILLDEVRSKLGLSHISDLQRIISVSSTLEPRVQGLYSHQESRTLKAHIEPTSAIPATVLPEHREPGTSATRTITSDLIEETITEKTPSICIRNGLDTFEAISTLVHELKHLHGDEFTVTEDPLDFQNKEDYVARILEAPGGELESFVTQARAIIRLSQKTGVPITHERKLVSFFDTSGTLKDREGLKQYILDDLGYRERLSQDYHSLLSSGASSAQTRLSYHRTHLASGIQENLDRHRQAEASLLPYIQSMKLRNPLDPRIAAYEDQLKRTRATIYHYQLKQQQNESEIRKQLGRLQSYQDRLANRSF